MQKLASPAQTVQALQSVTAYAATARPSRTRLAGMLQDVLTQVAGVRTAAHFGKPLYGHTSPETAYVVDDYPYGRQLRCIIRYWLESDPRRGFRFVSQTQDPRNGRWNRPKASTYSRFAGAMYLDEKDHVVWTGVNEYAEAEKVLEFVKAFPGADFRLLKPFAMAKVRFLQARAKGQATFQVNGVPEVLSEDAVGRARREAEMWEDVLRAM